MSNALWSARQEKGVLIAAHRGSAAGNIPCNTLEAFEAALMQGADMLETDITRSRDGELFIFHPGQERNHLNQEIRLSELTGKEIRQLRYVNFDRYPTRCEILTLDDFLEAYKDRCLINLDHGWDDLPGVVGAVRRHGMEEQILIKTPASLTYARAMEQMAPDLMYMPILGERDELSHRLERMNVNFVGAELVFATEQADTAKEAYIQAHHKKGRVLWGNAILYSEQEPLSAGHTDDISVIGNPKDGWGWLADRGFDIIQTDWVLPLRQYLSKKFQEPRSGADGSSLCRLPQS